ncbi:MAG TPA: FecR domain-containing protein [Bacteroidales bacterium]|nr:FecR domain-containing protein [Bacteroidales bacterium]
MEPTEQENREILITRYLTGEAGQEEIDELQKWLGASDDNLLYFQQLKIIWDNSEHFNNEKMIDVDKAFNLINKRVTFRSPVTNFWHYWNKIAAVLLIPLVLGNLLYFLFRANNYTTTQEPVYNELFAAFGTRSALKLSDGTSVWLNSGSSIKYPDRFVGNNRTIFLKGEAYFEVESDLKKPFIVETSSLSVKATGTKFNVSGYTSAEEAEVTLVSGKVEVSLTDDKKNIKSSTLDINQHFSFNKINRTTSISNVDTYKYIAWKDGKLVFRNEPLSNVVNKISQVFNIDIEIKGEEIQNYCFRATFQDESLTEILKLLKISSPIDYIEVKRNPLPDGSFPRKKVIIFPASQKRI